MEVPPISSGSSLQGIHKNPYDPLDAQPKQSSHSPSAGRCFTVRFIDPSVQASLVQENLRYGWCVTPMSWAVGSVWQITPSRPTIHEGSEEILSVVPQSHPLSPPSILRVQWLPGPKATEEPIDKRTVIYSFLPLENAPLFVEDFILHLPSPGSSDDNAASVRTKVRWIGTNSSVDPAQTPAWNDHQGITHWYIRWLVSDPPAAVILAEASKPPRYRIATPQGEGWTEQAPMDPACGWVALQEVHAAHRSSVIEEVWRRAGLWEFRDLLSRLPLTPGQRWLEMLPSSKDWLGSSLAYLHTLRSGQWIQVASEVLQEASFPGINLLELIPGWRTSLEDWWNLGKEHEASDDYFPVPMLWYLAAPAESSVSPTLKFALWLLPLEWWQDGWSDQSLARDWRVACYSETESGGLVLWEGWIPSSTKQAESWIFRVSSCDPMEENALNPWTILGERIGQPWKWMAQQVPSVPMLPMLRS